MPPILTQAMQIASNSRAPWMVSKDDRFGPAEIGEDRGYGALGVCVVARDEHGRLAVREARLDEVRVADDVERLNDLGIR